MANVLRDTKQFYKFCKKFDKDFKCREVLGCSVLCPLYWFREVDILMNQKRLPLGEAYRLIGRRGMDSTIAKKIIEDTLGMTLREVHIALEREAE